ncbi:MAG: hypothetical protein Q4F41_07025 [Eubacteriales bacterium]|nr:hypothetical protein [Eubacteriales bacterium]
MKMKTAKSYVTLAIAALFALLLSFAVFPQDALAASNKAARLKVSFNGDIEGDWDQNTYSIISELPKTTKVKNKMTVTYKLHVPKTLLKKSGDTVLFCMDLNLYTYNSKTDTYTGIGSINKTRWCQLRKEGKKTYLSVYNESTDKTEGEVEIKSTKTQKVKYATVKEEGKYYVITMKDVLGSTYYDYKTGKDKKINTKKTYTILPELVVHGDTSKLTGYVYLDEFTVNAVKKQTVTFNNKKSYNWVDARHYGRKKWSSKLKIVSI